jgi:hypothetical protein
MSDFTPDTEGIDHINIYSKSKLQLGRLLSNFAYTPFEIKPYGKFNSVEGFWYYYLTGCKFNKLKSLSGFLAKQYGRKLPNYREPNKEDKEIILEAIRCKLRKHINIQTLLKKSILPIVHYYAYGTPGSYKIYNQDKYDWMTKEIIRIREILWQIPKK